MRIAALAASLAAASAASADTIDVNGVKRSYSAQLPAKRPAPLVIVLHGKTQRGADMITRTAWQTDSGRPTRRWRSGAGSMAARPTTPRRLICRTGRLQTIPRSRGSPHAAPGGTTSCSIVSTMAAIACPDFLRMPASRRSPPACWGRRTLTSTLPRRSGRSSASFRKATLASGATHPPHRRMRARPRMRTRGGRARGAGLDRAAIPPGDPQ